ncbi:zinc finger protein [Trichonephila clavipes]|nr:zinc finger protein [Trichonephila clavipes]
MGTLPPELLDNLLLSMKRRWEATIAKSLVIRLLTFAERSFLTLADGAKYSLSCREQITHFLNFYTLADGAHKILAPLVERKITQSLDIHTALTGGAHRIRLLSSRSKSRLPLAWHSRMRRASDQSVLPPRVLEGV